MQTARKNSADNWKLFYRKSDESSGMMKLHCVIDVNKRDKNEKKNNKVKITTSPQLKNGGMFIEGRSQNIKRKKKKLEAKLSEIGKKKYKKKKWRTKNLYENKFVLSREAWVGWVFA